MRLWERRATAFLFGAAILTLTIAACGGSSGGGAGSVSILEFTAADFSVDEDALIATIAVSRTGRPSRAITIEYAAGGGTAQTPADYAAASGTLAWSAGDGADKTFDVTVVDDLLIEGDETVGLSLLNPSAGATLGSQIAAMLTIVDDDTAPPGSLATGFGLGGIVSSDPSTGTDIAVAVAIDASHLYVVGFDEAAGFNDLQWRVEKRGLSDGLLDPNFGAAGVLTNNPSPFGDTIWDVAIDSSYLYLVGDDEVDGDFNPRWRIEKRNLSDGLPDTNFGLMGVVANNPSGGRLESATGIAIDATSMYVIGNDESPGPTDWQWRIEKRSLADGFLDGGFGNLGVIRSDPSIWDDMPKGIALDAGTIYVVGNDVSLGNGAWRIEARSTLNGGLVGTFGTAGVVTENPSIDFDAASAVALDPASLYVVGFDDTPGTGAAQWRIEKRNRADGLLDGGFGVAGEVTIDPSAGFDDTTAVGIDPPFIYVIGYPGTPGFVDPSWRIEKRNVANGLLDPLFGTAGVVTSNPSPAGDYPEDIAIDSWFIYVVGYDESPGPGDWAWRIEKRFK